MTSTLIASDVEFDTVIDRRSVLALKHHRIVLGEDGAGLFPAGRSRAGSLSSIRGGFGGLNIACPRARLSAALDDLDTAVTKYLQELP